MLYELKNFIVSQSELEGEQFFLHLKNIDFKYEDINNFLNKRDLVKTIPHYAKLMKSLMLEFGHVLTNELSKDFVPNKLVDYKIDLVPKIQRPSKVLYRLN